MEKLLHWLESCGVCPNFCEVHRLTGEKGKCRTGAGIVVSSANLHFGEVVQYARNKGMTRVCG